MKLDDIAFQARTTPQRDEAMVKAANAMSKNEYMNSRAVQELPDQQRYSAKSYWMMGYMDAVLNGPR